MKIEHRREATEAGRHHLVQSLSSLEITTALYVEAARDGDKSTLLRAGELWEKAIAQAQAAKKLSEEFVDEELETWVKE